MNAQRGTTRIPLQVGSELRLTKEGKIILDNPEIELAKLTAATDAVLDYRFDLKTGEHSLRLLKPVVNRSDSEKSETDQ